MPRFAYLLIFLGSLCLACSLLVWQSERKRLSVGVAFLGLVAGMIIGLSETPIIASVVTSAFALGGTLIPMYLNQANEAALPKLETWLGPFATLLLVGILSGITIRANELLFFPAKPMIVNLRETYRSQGFTASQVESIMSAQAAALSKKDPPALPPEPKPVGPIALKSALSKISFPSADEAIKAAKQKSNPSESLATLEYDSNPARREAFQEAIREAQAEELSELKRTDPKAGENDPRITPELIFNRLLKTHDQLKSRSQR